MFITPDDIKLKLKQIVSEMTRTQGFGNFVFIKNPNNEFAFNYRDVEIISGYNNEEFEYTCKNIIANIYWDIEVVKQYYILQKEKEEYEKKKEKRNNKLLKKYKAL